MNKQELEKIKQKALEEHIPIIMDDTLEVVDKILKEVKPKRILEIGTARRWKNRHNRKRRRKNSRSKNKYKKCWSRRQNKHLWRWCSRNITNIKWRIWCSIYRCSKRKISIFLKRSIKNDKANRCYISW